ncbi:hypothetical protein KR067_009823 [Drosophila pandora]|nr:hypothetical protein KR067_009823 [Drosophila pandora]
MSKKMWNKIFKSKSQKPQPLGKINKRHSRGIYEEYQQLNDLLAGEKAQLNFSQNEKENDHGNGCGNGNGNGNGNINVFEQQPQQSSFNSLQLSEAQQQHHHHHHQQQQQQQQLSTFSRVRNTFSLKRNKKQPTNAKSSESDTPASVGAASKIDEIATATAAEATAAATAATSAILTNQSHANQLQRVLIVVNKIDVATNSPTNHHLHANPTKTPATAIKSTINATTDLDAEEPIRGTDDDPLPPPPPPLTTGLSVPVPEYVPPQSSDLTPCPCCSRTFNVNALRKHIVICEKSSKKRKVFDSSRQRREGTSLSTYVLPKNFGLPNAERNPGVSPPCTSREAAAALAAAAEPVSSPVPVRRKSQTEMVRSTARASLRKTASTLSNNSGDTAVATGAPAPAAVATSAPAAAPPAPRERSLAKRIKGPACDRCPHCDRTFNPKAFDRHVEWCKEKAIQATMKSGNSQETSKAKERLEARKQYRPPNLKTKRSLARDKYSGHHEEVLEAGDMSTPKPNMMSLSMTSSVHSDNNQMVKVRGEPSRSTTQVTQNQVSLYMSHDEDPPSSPPHKERMSHRSKRKQSETCCEIDETMDRLRRNAAGEGRQLATLDCVDAPTLKPVRSRKGGSKRDKLEMGDKEISLPNLPQVTMTFEELNGLIKRKGGTPICNVQMDEQEIASLAAKTSRSSTSLVRQARRRLRTRENPNLELRALEQEPVLTKNVEFASLDSSLVPLHRKQRGQYSASEDESPRAEIQIKLEATTMRTVCRPTKRSAAAALGNSEPMRALPMPQLKQSLEAINQSIGKVSLPRLELGNERKDDTYDQEEEISDLDFDEELEKDSPRVVAEEPLSEEEEEIAAVVEKPVMTLPPLIKQGSNVSRRLVVLEQDENGTMYIKSAPNGKRRLKSGLGDKYDPFLSAKRQLEELCSPNTPPPEEEIVMTTTKPKTPLTATPFAAPSISMTTSLTSSVLGSRPAPVTPKVQPASNFRRTSSLRGPRRTPLLPSRPLFATNYRPTIQRGLSDEGPISTNFLKPEEYDEMPVRAACGNDFHSPRVVRRDTSASNRKQMMKLPVGGASTEAGPSSPQPTRSVAKTDSLAVFLKYEHELEQLNAKAAATELASQLTSKDLKDKSNNLSKQNSAKSLGQSTPTTTTATTQLPPLTTVAPMPQSPTVAKDISSYPPIVTPLRLEPINKPMTPIKLESIFGPRRETALGSGLGSTTASVAGDYIDPKLINACDNLHVNSGVSSDASSTPQQLSQSRSRSSSQSTIVHERRQSGEARNLLKRKMRLGRNQFLYDASPEDAGDASSGCSADDEANRSSMEFDEQCWQQQQKQLLTNPLPMVMPMVQHAHSNMPTFDDFDFEEFLSSFENENDDEQFPLFKDCREFLLNRSTSRQRSFQKATSTPQPTATQQQQQHHHHNNQSNNNHKSKDNRLAELETQSRLAELEKRAAAEDQQKREIFNRNSAEDQQKREIFISIETEANAQGRSPISPDSLRHMVGNSQTPIDVLHIENGNEPEHARFSKISDTEDAGEEPGDRPSQLNSNRLVQSSSSCALAPNVQLNNAKNLIQKMQSDFRQLGEEASASMRRTLIANSGRSEEQQQMRDPEPNSQQQQQQHQFQQQQMQHQQEKPSSPLTPSPSADSDELSSLDSYTMLSRGAGSKLSTDSAYGSSNSPFSLSRQRSSELQPGTPRSQGLLRPHTANAKLAGNMSDASTQAHTKYGTLKARQRLFSNNGSSVTSNNGNGDGAESSSSGSENSLEVQQKQQQQQLTSNYNYQQQQQHQTQSQPAYNTNTINNNTTVPMTPTTSQHSLLSNTSNTSSMSSSMKMSKFCHECGAKFIVEQAKFCMECGVRRMVL